MATRALSVCKLLLWIMVAWPVPQNNTAVQYGGGLAAGLNKGAIALLNNTFNSNQAQFGGGFFEVSASALVTVTSCTFQVRL